MKRTAEEIERLKKNWLEDPCWDIEETEDFEEHRDELKAWREGVDAAWGGKIEMRATARAGETGIEKPLVYSLSSFSEIKTRLETNQGGIREQVEAILLLAAEVKRVADALENMQPTEDMAENVSIWGYGK